MLDFFLASVRKEPHLGLKRTFKSDCDAPKSHPAIPGTSGPFATIPAFLIPSSPCNSYFCPSLCLPVQKRHVRYGWFDSGPQNLSQPASPPHASVLTRMNPPTIQYGNAQICLRHPAGRMVLLA